MISKFVSRGLKNTKAKTDFLKLTKKKVLVNTPIDLWQLIIKPTSLPREICTQDRLFFRQNLNLSFGRSKC